MVDVAARKQDQAHRQPRLSSEGNCAKRTLVLLTSDRSLIDLVNRSIREGWRLYQVGSSAIRESYAQPNVHLIVLDDESLEASERGWVLEKLRESLRGAALLYVSSSHDPAIERRARTSGAQYYIDKPLDESRFTLVLRSFMSATET